MAKKSIYRDILKECLSKDIKTEEEFFKIVKEIMPSEQLEAIKKEFNKKIKEMSEFYKKRDEDTNECYDIYLARENIADRFSKLKTIDYSSDLNISNISFSNEEVYQGEGSNDYSDRLIKNIEVFLKEEMFEIESTYTTLRESGRSYVDDDYHFEVYVSKATIEKGKITTTKEKETLYHDDYKIFYSSDMEIETKPLYINPKLIKIAKILGLKKPKQELIKTTERKDFGFSKDYWDNDFNNNRAVNISNNILEREFKKLIKNNEPLNNTELDRTFKKIEKELSNSGKYEELGVIRDFIKYAKIYNEKGKLIKDTLDEKFKPIVDNNIKFASGSDYYKEIYTPYQSNKTVYSFLEFENAFSDSLRNINFFKDMPFLLTQKLNLVNETNKTMIVAREENFLSTKSLSDNDKFHRNNLKLIKKEKDLIKQLMIDEKKLIKETTSIEDITDNEMWYFISQGSSQSILNKYTSLKKININSKMQDTMSKSILGLEPFNKAYSLIKDDFDKEFISKKEIEYFIYKTVEGLDSSTRLDLDELSKIESHNKKFEQITILNKAKKIYNSENERKRVATKSNVKKR